MGNKIIDPRQGHWLLSTIGKRVLRPGGKELTLQLIRELDIDSEDNVVEFAPGIGYTARKILERSPSSYTGIELNEEAATRLRKFIHGGSYSIINTNAENTTLGDSIADVVIGEAMLTMHVNKEKSLIIKEAYRILKKGGLYGIHELGLRPDDISEDLKSEIQKKLSQNVQINSRPQTEKEWRHLLEEQGFEVIKVIKSPMLLLEPTRILDDEGVFRTLKIFFNVIRNASIRKRVLQMRKVFKDNRKYIVGMAIISRKK